MDVYSLAINLNDLVSDKISKLTKRQSNIQKKMIKQHFPQFFQKKVKNTERTTYSVKVYKSNKTAEWRNKKNRLVN